MRRFGVDERRARLGLRHHLAVPARVGVVEAARDLAGLHATDPATVYLAARARMRDPRVEAVEQALYEDRQLVRILGMRRTMFVEPVELMGVVQAACTDAIAVQQRRLLVDMIGRAGLADDPPGWVEDVEKATVKALEARGGATAAEVAKDDPRLAQQIVVAKGKPYEGRQSVVSRILLLLAAEGRIVRGRPRG
ncbi:MAG TPA: crosslink repair DNA glycosylase YcaQ family protein, partial [Actinomycetota bacterium]|nr:crosslink repair DNA glycosylase YcaQ family protein [Actinomycetota bacterium]